MKAKILEVCVGKPRDMIVNGQTERSGIHKSPITGSVALGLAKLAGDGQANLKYHGGREKAVYVYSADYYPDWQRVLGKDPLEPSQFGQNLTVDGFPDEAVHIGDRFRVGTALMEVAQPRIPCAKLAARVGREDFSNEFLMAGRLGYYLYTLKTGEVQAGDSMERVRAAAHGVTVARLCRSVFSEAHDLEVIKLALEFPYVDEGWKKRLRALLRKAV
jgi:MOSC domain-containing protein YiiM